MTIETRDLGRVEVAEEEILQFVSPIFGFEGLERFALLSDDEAGGGLLWLQSIDKPDICFILLDPVELEMEYHPVLQQDTMEMLQLQDPKEAGLLLIAVVPGDFKQTTVNLKSPVVINRPKRVAAQVILEADYPIRTRLFESEVGQ